MKNERYDFSYLLDNLKNTFNNFRMGIDHVLYTISYKNNKMDKDDTGYNKNGEIDNSIENINGIRFSLLYCLAYRTLYTMDSIDPIDNMNEYYINKALNDYVVFNSFMNNCVGEYNVYGDIGTGNIIYAPYESLASYIFSSPSRKMTFMKFLTGEQKSLDNENSSKKIK